MSVNGVNEGPHLVMTTSVDDAPEPSLSTLLAAVEAAPTPLERAGAVTTLIKALEVVEREAVNAAKTAGSSWSAIAEQLGVTKQAAARRFTPPREPEHVTKTEPLEKSQRRPNGKGRLQGRTALLRPHARLAFIKASVVQGVRTTPLPGVFWMVILLAATAGIVLGKWILPT
jgi:hypothetical protein